VQDDRGGSKRCSGKRASTVYEVEIHLASTVKLALLALMFLVPNVLRGQGSDFNITSWDTHNGLPEVKVQAVAVRPSGGVWVATEGGLCLFDGSTCKSLTVQESTRLPQKSFTALLLARDQSLWIGTEGGGLLHLIAGRLDAFGPADGLSDGYIRAIHEDSHGRLWVGTDYGLFRRDGDKFRSVPLGKNASPQFVTAIVEDRSGGIFVGGRSLNLVRDGITSPVKSWGAFGRPQIKSLLFTSDERLIIGTVDGVFENVKQHLRRLPFARVDVESLCQSGNSDIWLGTVSAGLWRMTKSATTRVALKDGNVLPTVLAMTTDMQGRLWVGTMTGLSRIQETILHFIPSPALAVDRETLAISPGGSVFLVNGGVYRMEGRKLEHLSFAIPAGTRILDVLFPKDGSTWLGTAGQGVYRVDPHGRTTQYSTRTRHKLSADYPRGIVEGTHGDIWVASELGVDVFEPGAEEAIRLSNALPSRAVRTLFLDQKGCMWIGTDRGPASSCNGLMTSSQSTSSLSGEEIWAITEDSHGTMWFGTRQNGIYAASNAGIRHFTVADGLPSNDICGLVTDRDGTLWASSLDQIFSVPTASLSSDRAKWDFVVPRSYVLPSGTEGIRFTRGRMQSSLLDSHGLVWFASDRGAAYITTPLSPTSEVSDEPRPSIRSVINDNSILPVSASIRTRPNPRQLVISFGADYLSPVQQVLLMYRLKGVDSEWTISTNPQQAEYSNLPAGQYFFELRACDRAQPERWNTTTYLITIPVIWYRSLWFSISLASFVLFGVAFAYVLHLRRLRYGFRLVLEERNRVAREMHDTLIQGCNGVAMLLEAEAVSRGETGQSDLLNTARTQIRNTVDEARDALWNLRQSEVDANTLRGTLNDIAAYAAATFGVPVDLQYSDKHRGLAASSAHELAMIVREAVVNAGTHGDPQTIVITVRAASDQLSIEVADDGVGFDISSASAPVKNHYGLRGMRERAEAIGARFNIDSKFGVGTVVSIALPWTSKSR